MKKDAQQIVETTSHGVIRRRFATAYDRHKGPVQMPGGPSLVKPEFQNESDINLIMERFNKTGQLPEMIQSNPQYGDFSSAADYQEAMNIVLLAQDQFDALPAHVRDRFQNDPEKFLEFTSDTKNIPEMVTMGLANQRQSNDDNSASPTHNTSKKSTIDENKPEDLGSKNKS